MAGGIRAWEGLAAAGPPDMGLFVLRGDESPIEFAALAYGLEEGLRTFYLAMAERSEDNETSDLFVRLAGFEERHKDRVYEFYLSVASEAVDREALEEMTAAGVMEGGFSTEEFISQNEEALESVGQTLDMALAIEVQALDLYLRFTQKDLGEETRDMIFRIAEDEKVHLRELGRLRGRKV